MQKERLQSLPIQRLIQLFVFFSLSEWNRFIDPFDQATPKEGSHHGNPIERRYR